MIKIRKSEERGHFDHGWLNTYHTFSFGDYFDQNFMGFRSLRVINEDVVRYSQGFPTHGHKNMEIVTYILEGALQHKDSMGNSSVIKPGDAQRMSAGKGIQHSEFNASSTEDCHLLQIWILPSANGGEPSYEQKHFPKETRLNQLRLIGSQHGTDGSITVHQDVKLYSCILESVKSVTYTLDPKRAAWIQVAKGAIKLNGESLQHGDGVAIQDVPLLSITADIDSEFLLFDLG